MEQLNLFDERVSCEPKADTLPLQAGDICRFVPLAEHTEYYRDFHAGLIGKEVIVEEIVNQKRLAAWIRSRTDRAIVYAEELQIVQRKSN